MTALTFIIDRFWFFRDKHPHDDFDNIMDRLRSECEYVGIDIVKVGRAAFAGEVF